MLNPLNEESGGAIQLTVLGQRLGGGGVAAAAAAIGRSGVGSVVLLEPTWEEVDAARASLALLGLDDRIVVRHITAREWFPGHRAA